MGIGEFGFPIYYDRDRIKEEINKVEKRYAGNDLYYQLEEKGIKLNFMINNDTNVFLDHVKISFKIDGNVFLVSDCLPEAYTRSFNLFDINKKSNDIESKYPNVEKNGENYLVTVNLKQIRHKVKTKLLGEDLRCLSVADKNIHSTKIHYELSARNLASPIKGYIKLKWD